MPTFKLTVAYDGGEFVGWQRQAAGVSVQGLLEDAFSELEGGPVVVFGAGRTDAGVHALGQVASATLTRAIDPQTLVRALNFHLPPAVRVLGAAAAPDGFHARFDACAKTYRFRLFNARVLSPFERPYVWHVPEPLNIQAMAEAARVLEGRHDFAAFQTAGAETATTERTIYSSRIDAVPEALVLYEVRGDGFLRHMVRSIVGTLVDIGRERHPPAWIHDVLDSKTRARAGRTAPPSGLFLVRVEYQAGDL